MNAGFFFAWLLFYLMAGRTIGAHFGEPVIGAVLGTVIGIFPAAMLCFASHYSEVPALLVFPLLIVFAALSEANKLWVAVVGGAAPLVWVGGVFLWELAAGKAKKRKKKRAGLQKNHYF